MLAWAERCKGAAAGRGAYMDLQPEGLVRVNIRFEVELNRKQPVCHRHAADRKRVVEVTSPGLRIPQRKLEVGQAADRQAILFELTLISECSATGTWACASFHSNRLVIDTPKIILHILRDPPLVAYAIRSPVCRAPLVADGPVPWPIGLAIQLLFVMVKLLL